MAKEYYLTVAESLAHQSEAVQKHGAVIVSGGKILASGYNTGQYSGKKLFKMYGPSRDNMSSTLHAESAALLSLLTTDPTRWTLRERRSTCREKSWVQGTEGTEGAKGKAWKTGPVCYAY